MWGWSKVETFFFSGFWWEVFLILWNGSKSTASRRKLSKLNYVKFSTVLDSVSLIVLDEKSTWIMVCAGLAWFVEINLHAFSTVFNIVQLQTAARLRYEKAFLAVVKSESLVNSKSCCNNAVWMLRLINPASLASSQQQGNKLRVYAPSPLITTSKGSPKGFKKLGGWGRDPQVRLCGGVAGRQHGRFWWGKILSHNNWLVWNDVADAAAWSRRIVDLFIQ